METIEVKDNAPVPVVLFVGDPATGTDGETLLRRLRSAVRPRDFSGAADPGILRDELPAADGVVFASGTETKTETEAQLPVTTTDARTPDARTPSVRLGDDEPALRRPSLSWTNNEEAVEHFLDEAYGHAQIRHLFAEGWTLDQLVAFNLRERYRVIVHDPKRHKLMGRIVAKAKDHPRERLQKEFSDLFLESLEKPTTRRKHLNVMETVREFLEPRVEKSDDAELAAVLAEYKAGRVPRYEPLRVLQRLVQSAGIAGLEAQSYLFPDEPQRRFLESAVGRTE